MNEKNNMALYDSWRAVPKEAQKEIKGGKLSGFTDINPMWRFKVLTERFGAAGIGWYYTIDKQWLEPASNDEICGFCNISLYVKVDGEWSKPIQGNGGSKLVAKAKSYLDNSDEVFKMALTDAISVACKSLGIGADIYFSKDVMDNRTKYDKQSEIALAPEPEPQKSQPRPAKADEIAVFQKITKEVALVDSLPKLGELYNKYPKYWDVIDFTNIFTQRKNEIRNAQ